MLTAVTAISAQGVAHRLNVAALLSPVLQERVRVEANAWIKSLRLVRYGHVPMRERFTYRGDSLWWFTEIYLHKMRRLEDALATVFALESAIEQTGPIRLEVRCGSRAAAGAARALAQARGITIEVGEETPAGRSLDAGLLVGVSALLSRLRPSPRPPAGPSRVAAFVHTAFWRAGGADGDGRESYIGDVLDAVAAQLPGEDLRLVGVGPRRNFRTRRWWDPIVGRGTPRVVAVEQYAGRAQLTESLTLWRQRDALASAITSGDEIRAAGWRAGVDLWPVLSAELADAARVQWTWSARAMEEARAALTSIEPDVAITYAEAGGWGRALVLEARRLGVPTVGLQHGFIYRHWLNYQHETDEMRPSGSDPGFPLPTCTLVFDRYAQATLETMGHFPPSAIAVTGSPRLDELAARLHVVRADRASIRRDLGVGDRDHLLILAAKASEIDLHLDDLFAAVASRPGLRLVIKPHPAETREAYLRRIPRGAPIVVQDAHADLGRLLAVADGLVTRNSTVAIDALVLGVPALVLGLPGNLSPFVGAGTMVGATGDQIGPGIETLLYDRQAREAVLERGRAFAEAYEMRADGGAARRAADHILAQAVPRSTRS
ncbi:MAG: hypothetical protein IT183_08705 [Acidobacteria bacterium]|nr:hypothetical protein [Acidobacteriota bacterium]